jgi:hypothetical protein
MKSDLITALASGADTAANANKKFGDAILKNICDNIVVTYAWAAANPSSGAADPATSFTATVSGAGTLNPSDSFAAMLVKLAALIKGLTITAASGFAVAPLAFNPAGVLSAVMANENNQDLAMEHFCTQIIASIKSSFPSATSAAGAHGAFTGATNGMTIS